MPLLKEVPKKGLILGTGGASKAIKHTFENLGIEPMFVSRTKKEGRYTCLLYTSPSPRDS